LEIFGPHVNAVIIKVSSFTDTTHTVQEWFEEHVLAGPTAY